MSEDLKFVVSSGDRNSWAVVGQKGSVELWYMKIDEMDFFGNGGIYGGLEWHSRDGNGEPSHTNCDLTKGNCWHEGSSLAFDNYRYLFNNEENLTSEERDSIIERILINRYNEWLM